MKLASTTTAAILTATTMCALLIGCGAHAQSCTGSYESTRLNPLPKPTTVSWTLIDETPTNQSLLQRFGAGLRESGIGMGSDGNVVLKMSFTLTPAPGNPAAGRLVNFNWADPANWSSGTVPSIVGSVLDFNAVVVEADSGQMDWIATGRCTVRTEDNGAIAEQIGRFVGRSLGSDSQRGRI